MFPVSKAETVEASIKDRWALCVCAFRGRSHRLGCVPWGLWEVWEVGNGAGGHALGPWDGLHFSPSPSLSLSICLSCSPISPSFASMLGPGLWTVLCTHTESSLPLFGVGVGSAEM